VFLKALRRKNRRRCNCSCALSKAAGNIPGCEVATVDKLTAQMLAPGAVPGRLTLWSKKAIEKLEKEKVFA
jgi:ribosomal protein L4